MSHYKKKMDLRQLKRYCQLGGGSRTRFNQLARSLQRVNRPVGITDIHSVLTAGASAATQKKATTKKKVKRKRKAGSSSTKRKRWRRKRKKKRAPERKRPSWMGDPRTCCILCLKPFTEGQRKRYCTDCNCVNRRHLHESCWQLWLNENGPVCPYCQGPCRVQTFDIEPTVIDLT